MKIGTKDLKVALSKVEGALPSKPAIAITAGLLFEVEDNNMEITATDLENTIMAKCGVSENGGKSGFVVTGKDFINLAKNLNCETVDIEPTENEVKVSARKSKYKFPVMDAEEFPAFPDIKDGQDIAIKGSVLNEGLNKVSFCVDKDEPRPHFRGALIDITEKEIMFVGTDTKSLALKSFAIETGVKTKILVPVKAISLLNRIFSAQDLSITVGKNAIFIKAEGVSMVSQLLSGAEDFPEYTKVVPSKDLLSAEIDRKELKTSMDRLSIFMTERYNKVFLDFSKDKLELSVINPEKGEAREEMPVKYEYETATRLAFNPMITDFISRAEGETLHLGLKDGKSPVLFTGEDADWKYVAMPLKTEA